MASYHIPNVDTTKPPPPPPAGKYHVPVGKNYWGEFDGYTYDPYSDTYYPERNAYNEFQKTNGLAPEVPHPPGPLAQIAPVAALLGTQQLIQKPSETIAAIKGIPGMLGLGGGSGGASVLGGLGGGAGTLLSDGSVIAQGAEIPAGLTAVGSAEVPASGLLGGLSSVAVPGLGALGLYDMFKHKRKGLAGFGEGAASGAALGTAVGMPWLGAGVGGLLSLAQGLFGGGESHLEEKAAQKLQDQGINLGPVKSWESNPIFAQSRKESDLKGSDIAGASAFYNKLGPEWGKLSVADRSKIGDEAIKEGIIREHNGGLDLTSTPQSFMDLVNQTFQGAKAPTTPQPKWIDGKLNPLWKG